MDLQFRLIRTYRLFSGSYDIVFGPLFSPGARDTLTSPTISQGQHILEVGVGTGLSLPHFRTDSRVTGIDVSEEMLAKARRRAQRLRLSSCRGSAPNRCREPRICGRSFDAVLALYVASVVPNPARFAAEMRRVCIPGGTIVVVNHFTGENLAARFIEKRLAARLARHIGFHADFPFDAFRRDSQLSIREVRPSNLFGYWKLLRCVSEKPPAIPG